MSDLFDEMASERQPHPGVRRRGLRSFGIISLLIAIIVAIGVVFVPKFFAASDVVADYPGPGTGSVSVVIPQGATGTQIAGILVDAGVIATASPFIKAYSADSRAQTQIDPSTYSLKKEMSAAGALAALMDDTNKAEIKVTIPEGFTKAQVYARLANLLGVDEATVESAAKDTAAIGLPGVAGGNTEGWFAPLTYTFQPGTTPTEAMKTMIAARVSQLQELGLAEDAWQATLIKASIVDKEVGTESDAPRVARVIENRLVNTTEVGGKLQMDSTVLYGVGKTGGVPTQAEIDDANNAYNTYQHAGLPPSPIGAASLMAIKAVMSPADGSWLYFVTVNLTTGETKFATTYDEHQKYVAELQAWLKANPTATN